MRAFRFSLQALHTLRLRKEHQAMEEYARTLLERARLTEQLQLSERALAAAQWEWQQHLTGGCTAAQMVHYQLHCRDLASRRDKNAVLAQAAERRAEAALQAMMVARQEREAVDKFFERQRAVYDRALNSSEQKFLDELVQRRPEVVRSASSNPYSSSP